KNSIQTRYDRIYEQLSELLNASEHPFTRMSTIAALLHHKMKGFFWTGFYFLQDGELIVGPYQGPIACLKLKKSTGVCWASVNQAVSLIVPDVHVFPGHIACSSLTNSEIVVPVKNKEGEIVAVLDVDSREFGRFDEMDRQGLEKIVQLIYN
ncbi:MAG TPA: GAF domain-containing protein, partial [Marinilabiliaceae bacterium]|nr:GAF domain-containing protein [Marinilabiliaceae bacterium]